MAEPAKILHVPLPIERDRMMLALVAFNLAFTGFDVYLAHSLGTIQNVFMSIPIGYAPLGSIPIALLAITNSRNPVLLAIHFVAMLLGITVGVIGFAFHLRTVMMPGGEFIWGGLIFSAPVLAALAFSGICGMGITAALEEVEPGRYRFPGLGVVRLWLTKRQLYFHFIGLGVAAAMVSAAIEHSQTGYASWTKWLPVVVGGLSAGAMIGHGCLREPRALEVIAVCAISSLAMPLGMLGFAFHLAVDSSAAGGISIERMVHGAPLFAPMLFADLGSLALVAAGQKWHRRPPQAVPEAATAV